MLVSLNDQLMTEQETNKDLKKKLIPLQQIKVKDFCKVKTSFCHMETIGAGRGNEWPLWMLQLVLEMLVNGTPPYAVSSNIASQVALTTPGVIIHSLPGDSYIRRCRTILRIIGETLTAYRLGKHQDWAQLFSDGTSRRQIALQNLVIGVIEDDVLRTLVLLSAIILKGESSEEQSEAIVSMVQRGAKRLERWSEKMKAIYPTYKHDIPPPNQMNLYKLGAGGAVTSDTCNAARKTSRILKEKIEQAAIRMSRPGDDVSVIQVSCWNHLRNIWLGGMTKALSLFLNESLSDDLQHIDHILRVSPKIEMVLRAVDKEFSLCANYPKGHGELFWKWIEEQYPGKLLFHVERTAGSRQDLCVEGAGAVYWNRGYWLEFLDNQLRIPGGNILQENIFVILSSSEMTALARVCAIIYLSVCVPTRWLAGNTHKLAQYNWSVYSMGRMVDLLESGM